MKRTRRKYPVICHPGSFYVSKGLCGACYQHYRACIIRGSVTGSRYKFLNKIVLGHESRKIKIARLWKKEIRDMRKRSPSAYRKGRNKALRDRYGLTLKQYNIIFAKQRGACAICKTPAKRYNKPLYVDHNHTTGTIRGLLCPKCNNFMSFIDNDLHLIEKAREYSTDVIEAISKLKGDK